MKYTFWHNSASQKGTYQIYHPRSLLAINPEYAQWFSFDETNYNLALLLKLTCGYKYWGIKGGHHFRHENGRTERTILEGTINES